MPMPRLLIRLSLLFTLLLTACLGLVRAQPHDDSGVLDWLKPPDGCPLNCLARLPDGALRLDDVLLALGPPDEFRVYEVIDFTRKPYYLLYPRRSLYVGIELDMCALSQAVLWHAASSDDGLWIGNIEDVVDYVSLYPRYFLASYQLDPDAWAGQLRRMNTCKQRR
jgi:hypothetical protein